MVVTHLPKLHTHFFISTPPPSLYTHHLSLLRIPKSTLTTAATAAAASAATSSTTHPPPISTPDTHIQIPLQNLFVPPETDISATSTPLTARILKGSNIVLSKYANDAQVVQAEFVKSSVRTEDCPSDGLPEFALVGRSNVGKSSLLNSLVRRKRLALTSKNPHWGLVRVEIPQIEGQDRFQDGGVLLA
ncbi:GTP-binding protein [Vitis vinifera]|uniref:GTP-binding protein n=1 Tax=Vitis vinifera TaxID=29760 RepID=A0A438C1Z5_VITVI|nr:GTP-binding protein [Vitis vinifera]